MTWRCDRVFSHCSITCWSKPPAGEAHPKAQWAPCASFPAAARVEVNGPDGPVLLAATPSGEKSVSLGAAGRYEVRVDDQVESRVVRWEADEILDAPFDPGRTVPGIVVGGTAEYVDVSREVALVVLLLLGMEVALRAWGLGRAGRGSLRTRWAGLGIRSQRPIGWFGRAPRGKCAKSRAMRWYGLVGALTGASAWLFATPLAPSQRGGAGGRLVEDYRSCSVTSAAGRAVSGAASTASCRMAPSGPPPPPALQAAHRAHGGRGARVQGGHAIQDLGERVRDRRGHRANRGAERDHDRALVSEATKSGMPEEEYRREIRVRYSTPR